MQRLTTKELKSALIAFMCTWGLQLLFGMTVRNPLTLVFFGAFYFISKNTKEYSSKTMRCVGLLVSFLAAVVVTVLFGKSAVSGFDSSLFRMMGMGIICIGLLFTVFVLFSAIVPGMNFAGYQEVYEKGPAKNDGQMTRVILAKIGSLSDVAVVIISAVICFLCWFPYFLYEYPGIMTADSIVQYEQIVGMYGLSNHHPVIHTLTIGFFYNIGMKLTGDVNKAMSFYTLAQMIFFALCCGRTVLQVKRSLAKGFGFVFALLFFALVPFNAVFAVTVWKDIPFAGIAMLMGCRLCEMVRNEKNSIADYMLLTVLAVLISLFRSNGWYAFLICIPFIIWTFRRDVIKAVISVSLAVLITVIIKGPVMNSAGIVQPDFTESLSLPIQQIARVLVEDREISQRDKELIDAVIDTTYIHELYAPDFADNMKELVRAGQPKAIEDNKGDYFVLWLRLGAKYPLDYIRAWFDLEGGYVYPDIPYEVGNIDGIMGNDYGLIPTPLIGGKAVVKGKEILIKLGSFVPLYGMLWSAGAYTWIVILALTVSEKNAKGRKYLSFMVLQAALILTLLIAAPVVDFRYEYGVIMLMPLSVAICVMIMGDREASQKPM